MTDHDPFAGGIQTAKERCLRINALSAADIHRVLERDDLQDSVRRHAHDRLRRLAWTGQHHVQRALNLKVESPP